MNKIRSGHPVRHEELTLSESDPVPAKAERVVTVRSLRTASREPRTRSPSVRASRVPVRNSKTSSASRDLDLGLRHWGPEFHRKAHAAHLDRRGFVADLHEHRQRGEVSDIDPVEEDPYGHDEPLRTKGVGALPRNHQRKAPSNERPHRRAEITSSGSEPVDVALTGGGAS